MVKAVQKNHKAILADQVSPTAILALQNKPGWHDLDACAKVFVIRGKAGAQRKHMTPGPQHPEYTLRTTWQWNHASDTWENLEFQRKWKLLRTCHVGSKIWAMHVFERKVAKIAQVPSKGCLQVDTGACHPSPWCLQDSRD